MYKEMITWANMIMKTSERQFQEEERQFILFYAYKTGDTAKTRELLNEMEHASEPGEMDEIFRRYSKQMDLKEGITHLAENILVRIERYRLEQENAIGYLSHALHLNGIDITEEEIRNTEITELKDKIEKQVAR